MLSLNKYLKTYMLLACMFLFRNILQSQNLVQNGSFENYTSPIDCGGGGFDNYSVFPNNHVVNNWNIFSTPDYFNSFCNPGGFNVPNSYFGYSIAKDGNAYAGIGLYQKGNETKEYIYQHLSQPLQIGKAYCLSFFVTRTERTKYAIKQIGAYFSSSLPTLTSSMYINANPQILNNTGFVSDTLQWMEIQGCFTANGGEQYVTIGNFNSNTNTDTLNHGTNNPIPAWPPTAYYYIDNITLIEQTTVGLKDLNNELGVVNLYPNPAKDVLNIDLGTVKENTELKIYNALGELVLTESLTTQNSSLKTHHLLSGIYFYRILVGDKIIKNDKVVIIK